VNSFNLGGLTFRRDVSSGPPRVPDFFAAHNRLRLDYRSHEALVDELPLIERSFRSMIPALSAPADFLRLALPLHETPSSAQGTGTKRQDSAIWRILPSNVSAFLLDCCVSPAKRFHDCADGRVTCLPCGSRLLLTVTSYLVGH
jgi:hypothetical protein